MLTINLLPVSERPCKWLTQRVVLSATLALVMLFCCLFAYNSYQIWSLEKQAAMLRQQHELLQPAQEKLRLAGVKQRILTEKNDRLIKITAERKAWKALLAHLGIVTPPQIWFSELVASEKNTLFIRGNARTYPDLAMFISKLEQDEFLSNPVLLKAEQDTEYVFTRFELTVTVKGI